MSLRIIGAGLGRTGTHSLKLALETLLGGRCYHMVEVFQNPAHVPVWHAAYRGERVDFESLMEGYAASVDWPAAPHWQALAELWPDAPVLLSSRSSSEAWFTSASNTIFPSMERHPDPAWTAMARAMVAAFTPDVTDAKATRTAYERHNAAVRSTCPPGRLVEWQPGDGWEPLCAALGLAAPDEPFPHVNTTEQFQAAFAAEP